MVLAAVALGQLASLPFWEKAYFSHWAWGIPALLVDATTILVFVLVGRKA
jgi:hypothetical protein